MSTQIFLCYFFRCFDGGFINREVFVYFLDGFINCNI